ncbi:phosphomannomutase [Aestuariivirga sp.]|uniref:phosphomannomutase n=1 Tax=Aestuariivirga sp. TaxID=2650926 RepID=UPI0025C39027|nr:phosphomannomutase [Aestuariivirga sp.]MCA3555043.1 phosphomannomutase [Aestuariivirga sp.]
MPATRRLGDIAAEAGAGFGTSGVRGPVASLTPGLCRAYAEAFLAMPASPPRGLLIGHDLRPSSPGIAAACHDAARRLGIGAINAGVLPTPALAFAAAKLGVPAIMVTGSHIPFNRNGLKFYRAEGEISKQDEGLILAAEAPWPLDDSSPAALPPADPAPLALYAARYRSAFAPDALSGLRIGVYEHSSAARDLLHELFRALGAETLPLARSDGFVAIDTEAVREEDRALALAWAAACPLDAIITTDGDADRPLIADGTGQWLRGDTLGLLSARELQAGTVVTPVNSTTAIESCGLFAEVRRTRIGSPHVIAGMQGARHQPVVGFEANGGFLLGSPASLAGGVLDPLPTRDAVLPLLLALSAARRLQAPLSQLLTGLPARFSFSGRLQDVDPAACRVLLAAADASVAGMERLFGGMPAATDRSDGLRATLASGDILHVRLSGNAPELRCYAEAATAAAAERLCSSCLSRLASLLSGSPS